MNFYRTFVPKKTRLPIYRARNRTLLFLRRSFVWGTDLSVILMRSRLEKLRAAYAGQRCFIMGNGPSLNKMDLTLFENEYVWASNKAYLLFERIRWRPKFYVSVDIRVTPDIAAEINALTRKHIDMLAFFPVRFREKWILKSRPNVYWYNERPMDETNLPAGVFSLDVAEWVSSVRTVTLAALQLAVHLGFNPIYLIGCDTSYSIPPTVEFEGGDRARLVSTDDDDPNHFDARYFGKGSKWHIPNADLMLEHYAQAKKACDSINVQVINATVGGKLEVFPRVDYRELFQ